MFVRVMRSNSLKHGFLTKTCRNFPKVNFTTSPGSSLSFQAQSTNSLQQLLNEKDNAGCSPLHYASREGHIRSLENLIRLGACINLKNNNNESPLHFAAR